MRNMIGSLSVCVVLPHLLVKRRDGLNGGVQGIDVHSLFCVGVEVQQSSHQVLNKAQCLTCHVPGFKLKPHKEHKSRTHNI